MDRYKVGALRAGRILAELAPLAHKPRDQYLASPVDELVAGRLLERIIGRMIDVNYHVLTESGQAPPPTTTPRSRSSSGSVCRVRSSGTRSPSAQASGTGSRTSTTRSAKVHAALDTALRDIPTSVRMVMDYVERAAG